MRAAYSKKENELGQILREIVSGYPILVGKDKGINLKTA